MTISLPSPRELTTDGTGPRIPLPTCAKGYPGDDTSWDIVDDTVELVRAFDVVSFPSIGEGYYSAGVAVGGYQYTDGHAEELYISVDAPGVALAAAQARVLAEQLLTAADALDAVTGVSR